MASFFKNISIPLMTLLFLQGCGVTTGVAPTFIEEINTAYDGVTCAVTVESDLSSAAFAALLEDGASESSPFIICIGNNVTIGSTGTNLDIHRSNIRIQGYSSETSIIHNARINEQTGVHFQKLSIVGTGGAGVDQSGGIGTIVSYKVIKSKINSNSGGLKISAGVGSIVTIEVRTSTITATGHGIQASVDTGGSVTGTISGNTILSNQDAVNMSKSIGGILTANLGPNILAASGASATSSSSMHFASGDGGIIQLDAIDSGTGTACNVATSAHTFNQVYSTQLGTGAMQTGSWSIAKMSNTNNTTIGTCAAGIEN